MKHSLLSAAILGILAGCAKQPEAPSAAAPTAASVTPAEKTATPEESSYVAPAPTITPVEQHPAPFGGATHACAGQNQCKGMGGCKTPSNACKGMNDCKGKGGCKG